MSPPARQGRQNVVGEVLKDFGGQEGKGAFRDFTHIPDGISPLQWGIGKMANDIMFDLARPMAEDRVPPKIDMLWIQLSAYDADKSLETAWGKLDAAYGAWTPRAGLEEPVFTRAELRLRYKALTLHMARIGLGYATSKTGNLDDMTFDKGKEVPTL